MYFFESTLINWELSSMLVEIRPSHFGGSRKIEPGGRHPPCKTGSSNSRKFFYYL